MDNAEFTLELRQKFAEKLGCFRRTETHRAFIIHQLAVKKDRSCAEFVEEWIIPSYEDNEKIPYDIWNQFVKFQQCLYCQEPCETSILKPYCIQCYDYVKDGCVAMEIKQITPEMQGFLRGELVWLCAIPNASKQGVQCQFCHKTNAIWWFGDMKRLCWDCFDQKLEKDGIYNIKLDFEK